MSKKKIIIISTLLAVIAGTYFIIKTNSNSYETAVAQMGSVTEEAVVSGNVNGASQSAIFATTTGIIDEVFVENGQTVQEGEQLLTIKSTKTVEEQKAAYAQFLSAIASQKSAESAKLSLQASLEASRKDILDTVTAQKKFNDARGTGKTYSQEEIDSTDSAVTNARETFASVEKQYLDAELSIQSAQAATTAAKASYDATIDSTVTAPLGGNVVNLSVKKGDNTTASSLTNPGAELLTIADFSTFTITAGVNGATIHKIALGQKAEIVLDTFPDTPFDGYVTKVDDIGKIDEGLVTYNIQLSFEKPDTLVKSGMTAEATIVTQTKNDVLTVPVSSLRIEDDMHYVDVLSGNNSIVKTPVKIGLKGSDVVEITEGLQEGDTVIIPSQ